MHGLDVSVFRWINGWSFAWERLFVFFSEATKLTEVRIGLVVIVIALIAAGPTTRRTALIGLASVGLANTLTDGLKSVIHVLRPCNELLNVTEHLGYDGKLIHLNSFGTASSHSANMAALAFVFVYYFKGWGAIWILVALLTGLSRVYVGVHYPSQVLLGWLCGLICAFIVIKTWEAFVKRRSAKDAT